MKILNFGSFNIDHVYAVDHLVRPGETIAAVKYSRFVGGKGCNQSIALANAGARVLHAGKIGRDGLFLRDRLDRAGADTSLVCVSDEPSGHAVIQVDRGGRNSIVLFGGANRAISAAEIDTVFARAAGAGYLLLQNEINSVPEIMRRGAAAGMRVVLNPAPMEESVRGYPLEVVSCFVVNEVEGGQLTGVSPPDDILREMAARYPAAASVLTLGSRGVIWCDRGTTGRMDSLAVKTVDTTAAGDTFVGYFLASLLRGDTVERAIDEARGAAALCVTRPGAADSIPLRSEVEQFRRSAR